MKELDVTIPALAQGSYRITIGEGILSSLAGRLDDDFAGLSRFVVTDANVVRAGHLETLLQGSEVPTFIIEPPGEISKNIDTLVAIIERMESAFLGRDTVVVALGGGTVGDIAGFAAAVFKRGVKVVQVPTTTVAQADSSVGGKTGVDSSVSKNAFGAFWQPAAVYIDVATLDTLDDRQYRAGLVESVKHALIADSEYFEFFEGNMAAILDRGRDVLEKIAFANCRIKADVVGEDPTEKNKRRILNYGHTVGHAVESAGGYQLLHGEAVAIGIVAAGLIERELSPQVDIGRVERIKRVLAGLKMPLTIPKELSIQQLIDIMKRDKKAIDAWPRFVLLDDIGSAMCMDGQWAQVVPKEIVERVLAKLR